MKKFPAFESKEEIRPYDPLEMLRRDFNNENIYRDKKEGAVIDDPDLHSLFKFYRGAIKDGTLLSVGAGTTHEHYMIPLEDKLSHITALDLSPTNINLIKEFQEMGAGKSGVPKYINKDDMSVLNVMAEAVAKDPRYGEKRTGDQILRNIDKKTRREDGSPDLIVGNMFDLDDALGGRKFDNIVFGFSLFAPKGVSDAQAEFTKVFAKARKHLNPNGRLIITDTNDFADEDLKTFHEDDEVIKHYTTDFRLDAAILKKMLQDAGFAGIEVRERPAEAEGEEQKLGWEYLFATARV